MDRNKPGSSRPGKSKVGAPQHSSELFALGSKSTVRDDSKNKVICSNKTAPDRKRDATTSISNAPSKKPKLITSISINSNSRVSSDALSSNTSLEYWEQVATDCEAVDLITAVLAAIEMQDSDTVISLVCGAVKALVFPRSKPEAVLSLSLMYLAKIRSHLFCNETITSALISILKKDPNHIFKGRNNSCIYVIATNLLARGYHNKTQWPEIFVRVYIDDAISDRVWVDIDECSSFVENVCTAFETRVPPKAMLQPECNLTSSVRDSLSLDDDTEGMTVDMFRLSESNIDCPTQPRFDHLTDVVEKLVLESVKEMLNRRQAPDSSTRNLLRFLSATSGISEIRILASYGGRLEHWMHNSKLIKPAQELLTYICYNVTGHNKRDHEVLANLVKMRLKTKPLINIYISCLKEMINLQPSILHIVLKYVVQNELSSVRNPNNMGMLASIFQTKPEESAQHLADIYQEFILQREDCLRTLRVFLRELVKILRFDIKIKIFCKHLLTSTQSFVSQCEQIDYRDRVFFSLVDLVCLCMFLSVSPQIKEANISMRANRENHCSKVLYEFYEQMSYIQCDALQWIYDTVPVLFKPGETEYNQSLHKLLFLESPEQYSKGDLWPPEQERTIILRLVSETPLHQDSILCLILIGINKDIPFKVPDTVEVIEKIVRRAAAIKNTDYPALQANKLEIIDFLFSMAEYHHPENIVLPRGYEPPKLAISSLYWKSWNILLMLSAHNPSTFGAFCWEQYPMLRNLMEMCITNQFTNSKQPEEELQVATVERSNILEFEKHLAAATSKVVITEQNSLLLSQLMLMDPLGVARRPPMHILEQMQSQNSTHKLGHLLCRSRKPDLLLDIIQRQGSSQSMPWLADLVQNSEGDFNHLPVQCLCEFLLSNSKNISFENSRDIDLVEYLQKLLTDENGDHQISCEVLEYFLRRLSSTCKQSRQLAIKGLQLLLKNVHTGDDDVINLDYQDSNWLLHYLPLLPYFLSVRLIVIVQLRAACQIENNPDLIMIYIQFIAANTLHDAVPDMLDHVMDMSQLIIERSTVFSCITPTTHVNYESRLQTLNCLFVMYNNYLIKLREYKTPYSWPEYPDLLMVNFGDGIQLLIHLNIIQSFVILLTYSPMIPNSQPILDYWFTRGLSAPLQAFSMDASEQIQILPDWLKLKMIRSSVDRLVDEALIDLSPDQIILFVQNFGTPVNSMSKLLALLDRAVVEQIETVKMVILNKLYLAQLIEIQQARGAKNGHIAVQALDLHAQILPDLTKRDSKVVKQLHLHLKNILEPSLIPSTNEIEELIEMILTNKIIKNHTYHRFRQLMQHLIFKDINGSHSQLKNETSTNVHTFKKVLKIIHKLLTQPSAKYYFQNGAVCSLYRSLFSYLPQISDLFVLQVIDLSIQNISPIENPVVLKIVYNKRDVYTKFKLKLIPVESENLIQILQSAKFMELEKKGRSILNELFKQTDPIYLVRALTKSLKKETTPGDKTGILVDWLSDIDSELVVSIQDYELELLFSRSLSQFHFYLLSLLSHHSSWTTLHSTLNELLNKFNSKYNPTSVLHFISALICNPKLWQGRDKATPKHLQIECVVHLNYQQVQVFADYILSECCSDIKKLNFRVETLLKCVNPEAFDLKIFVQYVHSTEADKIIRCAFLQHLYLNIPSMKFIVSDLSNTYTANVNNLNGCVVDQKMNYILTALSALSMTKDFQTISINLELLVRKFTASHPSLILRQLSVLVALLQGRAHMDIYMLRNSRYIYLFSKILGILELLQPQLFEEAYSNELHQAFDCYFTLLKHHSNSKDINQLLYRFMDLLEAYTNICSNRSLYFIEPYAELIQNLSKKNRHIIPLQNLVQVVALLQHRHNHDFSDTSHSEDGLDEFSASSSNLSLVGSISLTIATIPSLSTSSIISPTVPDADNVVANVGILTPYSKQHFAPQNWPHLVQLVGSRNVDEVLLALQEIEIITAKQDRLLSHLFNKMLDLLESSTASIRTAAHKLLVRYLNFNPGHIDSNEQIVTAYVQCLHHCNPAIAASALETLTEMVICLQEYAPEILEAVFYIGIKSKHNPYEQLRRCISALKIQHAC